MLYVFVLSRSDFKNQINVFTSHWTRICSLEQKKANGKQVIIPETGWPSQGLGLYAAVRWDKNGIKLFIVNGHFLNLINSFKGLQ